MLAKAAQSWSELDLAARRAEWDESYGHIVTNKETGVAERQNLVQHVKQFATAYKADPQTERVEALLRYMKRFINALYERVEVAEDAFLNLYEKIAMIDDPAPALSEAQARLTDMARSVSQLERQCQEQTEALAKAEADRERAVEEARAAARDAAPAEENRVAVEYQRQVAALEHELHVVRGDRDGLRRQIDSLQEQLGDALSAAAQARTQALADTDDGGEVEQRRRESDAVLEAVRKQHAERVERLQKMLDDAQKEADAAVREGAALREQLRRAELATSVAESERRRAAAEADARVTEAQRNASAAREEQQPRAPPTPTSSPATSVSRSEAATASEAQARLARRVTELQAAVRRAHDENSSLREQLRDARTAALASLAGDMVGGSATENGDGDDPWSVAGPTTAAGASGAVAVAVPASPASGAAEKTTTSGGAGGLLSDADFSSLLGGGAVTVAPSSAAAPSSAPAMPAEASAAHSAGSGDQATTQALFRQRDALKRQLADAHRLVAQLRGQLTAPRFPDLSQTFAAQGAKCANCSGPLHALRSAASATGGQGASGAPLTGPNAPARKRDVALNVLDRVGLIVGQLLQVHRAARIATVVYLLTLHLFVFTTVTTWSGSHMSRHTTVLAAQRPAVRPLVNGDAGTATP